MIKRSPLYQIQQGALEYYDAFFQSTRFIGALGVMGIAQCAILLFV